MLAGVAAVSLSVGTATAQEGGSGISVPGGGFNRAPHELTTKGPGIVQPGSSNVDTTPPQSPYPGVHTSLFTYGS